MKSVIFSGSSTEPHHRRARCGHRAASIYISASRTADAPRIGCSLTIAVERETPCEGPSPSSVVVALAALQSACVGAFDAAVVESQRQQLRQRLPPPLSEDLRRELRAVKLSAGGLPTAVAFSAPAKGAGEGSLRGAGMGAGGAIAVGAVGRGEGLFVGIRHANAALRM